MAAPKIELDVKGMTCANCASSISTYLKKKGLKEVFVDFSNDEVVFQPEPGLGIEEVKKDIEKLGYTVTGEKKAAAEKKGLSTIEKKFWFCAILSFPLLLHMLVPHDHILNNPWLQLALATPVFIVGLLHFGKSGLGSLKSGAPNMDVLVTIGSSAAYIYSLIGTIQNLGHNYLFYETAAMIITLILLGNVLEHRSIKKTTSAIKDLSKLQADKAKLVTAEGIKEIDAKNIERGQHFLVNSGDKIPIDGKIIKGSGLIDEAIISGESLPVEKEENDRVVGGTMLQDGNITIEATAVGEDTVLSRIIELVKMAQSEKPGIQKLADKISAVFVPIVVAIAVFTFAGAFFVFDLPLRQAMMNSIAVLVIACPCAMGLATPTAVIVGIGKAAKNGILIKGGSTMETFANIKQIVFDKTGTLTTGDFKIKNITAHDAGEEKVKAVVSALERHSSHPIAKSLVKELKNVEPVELKNIKETKGLGIEATDTEGNSWKIGSYQIAAHVAQDRQHNLYLLKNNKLAATIDIEDDIKEDARQTINYFKKLGVKTILLSGDSKEKCDAVAEAVGIEEVHAEKKPDEKLTIIERLNKTASTAMVGDGINDAPALAKADIGISLSNATDVAIQSAQIILLQGRLSYLIKAMEASKHTLKTIKQNLFWAFFYNVIAIPIAAVGLLRPMIAALSMAFSDVIVIGNSLRLKKKDIFKE